jgi:hypothetical protein
MSPIASARNDWRSSKPDPRPHRPLHHGQRRLIISVAQRPYRQHNESSQTAKVALVSRGVHQNRRFARFLKFSFSPALGTLLLSLLRP